MPGKEVAKLISRRLAELRCRHQIRCQLRKTKALYTQFLNQGDLCFDVGAHFGLFTDAFLALGARVVCIEPQPNCADRLAAKYRDNQQVLVVRKGVAAQAGVMSLSLCARASTIATFSEKWKTGRFSAYEWESAVNVPVTTLDILIGEYGLPAFCKIDVEGFEYQVLRGLSYPIPALSFEFTSEFIEDAELCINHLMSLGSVSFNAAVGESATLVLPNWTNAHGMIDWLHSASDELFWGDVFAKFGPVR